MGRLLSVNVGLPRDITWQGKTVHTGIWKAPVTGPRMVRRLNIDGDGQGDLNGHGGERRAVFVYQMDSYRYWQSHLGRNDFIYGQFGENFSVDGLSDAEVCIGDRYRIGGALFEVTQPRVTCYRLGIRMNEPEMAALVVKHGRPGFYFRVLEEGEVAAGDEITQVASGPERMSVSEIDALLYKPGHPRDQLERALRIPVLSVGWRRSLEALLTQQRNGGATTGNAGLGVVSGPPPAWRGFRPLRVSRKVQESGSVTSLLLEPTDGEPVAAPLPGQFVVLRLEPESALALMRSYSLSGAPGATTYRVSVKREAHGAASAYIDDRLQVGDIVQASAARGDFTLRPGDAPVVLLSAGIGVTPVLAMLHALAAEGSAREIWWLYGTRNGREHPFAEETRGLLNTLSHHHSYVCYSSPDPEDRADVDFDAVGHLSVRVLGELNLPRNGDFYICGPSSFMSDLTAGLEELGVTSDRIHTETFGAGPSITPGIAAEPRRPPHLPAGAPGSGPMVSFARSALNVRWGPSFPNLLELAEACDVPVRYACRTGVCHTCESGLVAGKIGYRPDPVDAPADGIVLICCAQPEGDVVIDL
ncbi:MOSC and FAD-binding oxidoreductase domain-containing protein [Bradyrhizobium sp. 164]|uniref:MOSC and FAD-binding oxidoreductase domain-containing protein n=1 Tax=Bradyrhizobium sp. 164 TaxID=2782637 RepID=UPI001FFAFF91|nr:MOSC and FAD-binding oxidoreductase domain-containing protein [Bradyrhizobium sp. 164]MCK1595013.1 MOSC domain-containing protein [Bradyrhizobium sp. 164]